MTPHLNIPASQKDHRSLAGRDLALEFKRENDLAHASALARAGRLGEAEALLKESQRVAGSSARLMDLLGRVLAQQGVIDEAEQCFRRALEYDPGNRDLKRKLAELPRLATRLWFVGRATAIAALAALATTVFVVILKFDRNLSNIRDQLRKESEQTGLLISGVKESVNRMELHQKSIEPVTEEVELMASSYAHDAGVIREKLVSLESRVMFSDEISERFTTLERAIERVLAQAEQSKQADSPDRRSPIGSPDISHVWPEYVMELSVVLGDLRTRTAAIERKLSAPPEPGLAPGAPGSRE